ncbi:MAG: ABC transporter substrate-binding protein [Chloroflexota bacterium]
MSKRMMKRREFLRVSTTAVAGSTLLAACGGGGSEVITEESEAAAAAEAQAEESTSTESQTASSTVTEMPSAYSEAPSLADMVASGDLPPVEERIPVNPLVLGRQEIGSYGGEVRMIHLDPSSFVSEYGWFAERMLSYSDDDLKTLLPNMMASWEVSDDATEFTFHLHEGMKWSTGDPVTTEDVDFWWNDVATNTEISSRVWWVYRHGGENMTVDIMDDFTFKLTFAAPFGNFPAYMTRRIQGDFLLPKEYMKQFHASYADADELAAMVEEAGFENWVQLFNQKNSGRSVWGTRPNSPEYPMLSAWIVDQEPEQGLVLMKRNPYYWKVDASGQQFPYVDSIRIDLAVQHEIVTQKIIQGELDYVGPHDVSIARFPLYKENEEAQHYQVSDYLSCMTDRYTLYPNHTLPEDPVLQEIVRHPNFVKALNVAIDREEINQSLFFGLAKMGQLGPMPNSQYYKEEYGSAWAQFDPDLANQLLDEMGLDQKNSDGIRLRPDGEPLRFNIEHAGPRVGVATHEYTEIAVTFWREVGIDASTKELQISLYNERWSQGLVHCGAWHADRCTDLLLPIEMRWYIPVNIGQGGAAPLWGQYFQSGGNDGEEPPAEILKLFDLYNSMNTTSSDEERVGFGQQIFDWLAENPLAVGSVLESPAPLIFPKNMKNLPAAKKPVGWDTYGISTYHPEAFFYSS